MVKKSLKLQVTKFAGDFENLPVINSETPATFADVAENICSALRNNKKCRIGEFVQPFGMQLTMWTAGQGGNYKGKNR